MAVDFSAGYFNGSPLASDTHTFVARVRTPATLSGFQVMYCQDDSRANNPCIYFSGNQLGLGDEVSGQLGATTIAPSTWYDLAWIRNGLASSIAYLNGVQEVVFNTQRTGVNCTSLLLGAYNSGSVFPFQGLVSYAKIWNAALTVDEIRLEHSQVLPVRSTNLWAFSSLPPTTNRNRDWSGNGRNWAEVASVASSSEESNTPWGSFPLSSVGESSLPVLGQRSPALLLFF
jgi:hypothetical protein